MRGAQESAEASYPGIDVHRKLEVVLPVGRPEFGVTLEPVLCVHDHRAELQALEFTPPAPAASLPEKNRSPRGHLHRDRGQKEDRSSD